MKRGQHIGKIIISNDGHKVIPIPMRPPMHRLQLQSHTTYLIVGGIKGLCGSVAVHMAQNGARHLTVMSRSGLDDEASAKIIEDCASYDCEVYEARGDVSDINFVRRVFRVARSGRKIVGIIQGAMVLKVSYAHGNSSKHLAHIYGVG